MQTTQANSQRSKCACWSLDSWSKVASRVAIAAITAPAPVNTGSLSQTLLLLSEVSTALGRKLRIQHVLRSQQLINLLGSKQTTL